MALDKLVDSTQLNSALTATANAIRSKTGDSGTIAWDSSTGFSDAVDDIQTGATISELSVTANGTYIAPAGAAYSPVTVSVPGGGSGMTITALDVTENGTYTAPTGTAYNNVTVNVSEVVEPVESGVEFFDYDGTLLYAYTTTQALQLTALPENPSHTGLTAQGWNWGLADIKTYLTNYPEAVVDVGQMYITDDGKTRIYIHLGERKSPMLGIGVDGSVDVDWGDGTAHSVLTGDDTTTVVWTSAHEYAKAGDYVIKLAVTGSAMLAGSSTSNQYSCILRHSSETTIANRYYLSAIYKIEIGSNIIKIGTYALYMCNCLETITIPTNVTTINGYSFQNCSLLKSIVLPNQMTVLTNYCLMSCNLLTHVALPASLTNCGSNAFQNCYNLLHITIPPNVTSVGSYMISGCWAIDNIIIPTTVSTLSNNCFQNCMGLRKVEITRNEQYTNIPNYLFYGDFSLTSIVIPSNISSIANNSFTNCLGLKEIHLLRTTPPTLAYSSIFSSVLSDCIFYVPYSADHSVLDAYKAASNWSNYASQMQEEPQV